jgi:sugar-specific transcriptional regulator TrmB
VFGRVMQDQLQQELEKIGLSEKEAKVYLAGLAIGPATAQTLAAKAVVNRPTTYVMIESLIQRGLMSSFEKGKRRFFVAADPEKLKFLCEQEQVLISEKLGLLKNFLPALKKYSSHAEQPVVTMFEGEVGLKIVQEDLIKISRVTKNIDNIAALDPARKISSSEDMSPLWSDLMNSGVKIRTLYTSSTTGDFPKKKNWQTKKIPSELFDFSGEISIYGNKVAALAVKQKTLGIIVESKEIADTMRVLFNLAWKGASKY